MCLVLFSPFTLDLSFQLTSFNIGDVEIAGQGELHDNHHYVNAVFTKEAVQKFDE